MEEVNYNNKKDKLGKIFTMASTDVDIYNLKTSNGETIPVYLDSCSSFSWWGGDLNNKKFHTTHDPCPSPIATDASGNLLYYCKGHVHVNAILNSKEVVKIKFHIPEHKFEETIVGKDVFPTIKTYLKTPLKPITSKFFY